MTALAGQTGRFTLGLIHATLKVCVLISNTCYWIFLAPLQGKGLRVKSTLYHFVEYGPRSLPIVMLISFIIGSIMALQGAYQLTKFGADHLIANLVSVAAMRELAPLMAAILLAGRSGSAITAEIGTMKVAEEIDALEVMGINPIKFLVVPKFIAMTLAVPMVTVIAMFTMIAGGTAIAVFGMGMDARLYIEQSANAMVGIDLATGMTKSVFFAIVICWVGLYRGFRVEGGAEGVGKETTSSVVISIFLIIVVDMIFTWLFYSAG